VAKAAGIKRSGQVEVVVDAPIEAVWQVLSDVTRVGEWSHECRSAEWLGGARAAAPGVRFRGRSKNGQVRWSRVNEFTRVEAPREIAWRTRPSLLLPDSTEWRFELEPAGNGTRIVQAFQVLRLPPFSDWLYSRTIPAHRDRTSALAEDLRRLGALAAAPSQTHNSAA
jgi:uncharacterized membrane protein